MNLASLLVRAARLYPQRPAVLVGSKCRHTYGELAARTGALAGFLRHRLDLARDDRVAIYMTNGPAYLETLYAVLWAGLVAVPINAKLHPRELEYILEDTGARALFMSDDLAPGVAAATLTAPALEHTLVAGDAAYEAATGHHFLPLQEREPGALAWLFYTSGTTGRPKGVMLTHRNLFAMLHSYFTDVDAVGDGDCVVYAAPMSHGAGLYGFPYMLRGCRHVLPESGHFNPDELIDLASDLGHLCLFAAPTMVRRLVDRVKARETGGQGFKTIVYGGGPMYLEDIRDALATMGPRFVQIYGQGESPMTITALPRHMLADRAAPDWATNAASVGFAQSAVEVRLAHANGKTVAEGEVGEILVRGDVVMAGYWRNPEATAKALRDGWLWTGDMGTMDSRGLITLKDRSKDVIISGGTNIYPREVEEALLKHPGVREVSVVGQADPEWGEIVIAFVVGADDLTAEALDALCLAEIARFKRPRAYRFLSELPKNSYGKVLKTALRTLLTPP
ncbi:long-chain fatty acid--CoA ligase [Nitrogeniibacter mangrovi]|uniref:Long-chain fatty acid--CoA ligase n=1 Tax=Nitrogeniibacter mangrovi TaxID=2016596 RepID=A0A6C1AYE9_9RHOO|nr:AMP-binding protein [Nitrogeniibacter mangrovi]QID16391.1 long-chain fatty acid--CoA ligase [Nitrogeniibacter mangrovi]